MPLAMNQDYGPGREGSWEFHADKEHLPAGLAEQMDLLREKIDDLFAAPGSFRSKRERERLVRKKNARSRVRIAATIGSKTIGFLGNHFCIPSSLVRSRLLSNHSSGLIATVT